MTPLRLVAALRRRLRWPIPLAAGQCRGKRCRGVLDTLGDHAASCPKSGLLKLRSKPIERTWARIMREAGARVRENFMLRDSGISSIDPADGRRIEVVVTGLPLHGGIPLAIDATLVSPLDTKGEPHGDADACPGVAIRAAEKDKARTYHELMDSGMLRLKVAASEIGGRLNAEGKQLVRAAAVLRSRDEPALLRSAVFRALHSRWLTMLSVAVQEAVTATIVDEGVALLDAADGPAPLSVHMWLEAA